MVKTAKAPDFSLPLPSAEDVERQVIARLIHDPKALYGDIVHTLKPDSFHHYGGVFQAIRSLMDENKGVSVTLVLDKMRQLQKPLPEQEVVNAFARPDMKLDLMAAASRLLELHDARNIAGAASIAWADAMGGRGAEASMALRSALNAIEVGQPSPYYTLDSILPEIDKILFSEEMILATSSFIPELTEALGGGFPLGCVTSVLARPSMGAWGWKTD